MNSPKDYTSGHRDTRTVLLAIAAFVMIVSIGVILFLRSYNEYIDQILYKERLNQMQEVTTQLFNGLEDVVQSQWNAADIQCNYVKLGRPRTADDLIAFMKKQAALQKMPISSRWMSWDVT